MERLSADRLHPSRNDGNGASISSASDNAWRVWLSQSALPLWSGIGFDHTRRLFQERLTFDQQPIPLPGLRLMVQARQIATYCRAALDGLYDDSGLALDCLQEVERRYRGSDGENGWIFSLAPDGKPASVMRDLYAHAFILFAYAWAYRLSGNPAHLKVARETISDISVIFQAPGGGYLDAVPSPDTLRRQNPHMHLLESYLALFEVSSDEFYLDEARSLVQLALDKFIEPRSGMLLEFFNSRWQPNETSGRNRVEPGHLFEWAWLFAEYRRLATDDPVADTAGEAGERLFDVGRRYGISGTTVIDAITENGDALERSTRIWPQTELMRYLSSRADTSGPSCSLPQIGITETFFAHYVPASLSGGWIDRRNASGKPSVDHMPASSLYHIYGAAREFIPR
jgi:mannose/cellobiose epimerase-like protein (N-acyl-D-glucosamine 2-epimerase family)